MPSDQAAQVVRSLGSEAVGMWNCENFTLLLATQGCKTQKDTFRFTSKLAYFGAQAAEWFSVQFGTRKGGGSILDVLVFPLPPRIYPLIGVCWIFPFPGSNPCAGKPHFQSYLFSLSYQSTIQPAHTNLSLGHKFRMSNAAISQCKSCPSADSVLLAMVFMPDSKQKQEMSSSWWWKITCCCGDG